MPCSNSDRAISRRSILAAGGLAAFGAQIGRASGQRDGHGDVETFARLQGHGAGRTGINHSDGFVTALVDGRESIPLMRVTALAIDRFTPRASGGYARAVVQMMLFRDIATGTVLDRWRNPITHETLEVVHFLEGPRRLYLTGQGYLDPVSGQPIGSPKPFKLDIERIAARVFITKRTILSYPNFIQPADDRRASTGERDYVTEEQTFIAAATDFDSTSDNVATSFAFTAVFGFFPFMMLGQVAGRMLWTATGTKLSSTRALPSGVADAVNARFAGVLDDPFSGTPRNSFREFAKRLKRR